MRRPAGCSGRPCTRGAAAWLAAACALWAASPARAHAQARSDATVYDRDEERRAPEVVPVRARFERPLDARCALRARLAGELRVEPARGRARYAPALRVESAVECDGRAAQRVVRTLRSTGPLTQEELALAVDARARVRTAATGRPCEYRPAFEFDGARFTRMTVAQACEYASPAGP